jgi:hypothetical protein
MRGRRLDGIGPVGRSIGRSIGRSVGRSIRHIAQATSGPPARPGALSVRHDFIKSRYRPSLRRWPIQPPLISSVSAGSTGT